MADDEQFIRAAYKEGLEQAGFKVVTAADGEEALKLALEHKPGLMLLDLIMPKLNGFDVLKEMRKVPELKDTKVMVMTNLSQDTDRAAVTALGAADFMVKSDYSLQQVVDKVKSYL